MAPNEKLAALSAAGVSIWLDDLSRERLTSGNLKELITDKSVVGVTTNPTIFAAALANGDATTRRSASCRRAAPRSTRAAGTVADVQQAGDVFARTWEAPGAPTAAVARGEPALARDTDGHLAEAHDLWKAVGRPNRW